MADITKLIAKFNDLREILLFGDNIGINVSDILKKIDNVIETITSGEINIALIGSFSDGKTSAIAGLLGEVLSNMKIAVDESSDEIKVYCYHAFGKDFRIVDTPGLFGTKEKEVEGEEVRFSDITVKYLSEAHVVIYVCDAVNPLKDSHLSTIKHIMCNLGKLESTIFVINKMDEAGYDLTDDYDFNRGKDIKISTLKKRLKESLDLSDNDVEKLNIVCIAADPKGKGVEKWFTKLEDYTSRSHINDFKALLNQVVSKCDVKSLNLNVENASIKEMVQNVNENIDVASEPYENTLVKLQDDTSELNVDMNILHSELISSKNQMIKRLDELKNDIVHKIDGSNLKTVGTILQNDLGVQDGNVTMYILERDINMILSECSESNNSSITVNSVKIEKKMEEESTWIKGQMKKGAELLGKTKIDGNMVKTARDIFVKNHKFKPWGAVKLGEKLTKWLGRLGIAITVLVEAWEWFKEIRDIREFNELKNQLFNAINDAFADVASLFATDNLYYQNFAPSYVELKKVLEQRDNEILKLQNQLKEYDSLRNRLYSWSKNAEVVDFAEVNDKE